MKVYTEKQILVLVEPDKGERIYSRHLRKMIYPEAAEVIQAHKKKGHGVVIVSSATHYQIAPVAKELGVSEILCTRFEVNDGVLTGGLDGPPCFGTGKVDAATDYCRQHRKNLANCFFYSDSIDDLPLLDAVGNPVPLNPDKKLKAVARENNWPIYQFNSRGTPSIADVVGGALSGR